MIDENKVDGPKNGDEEKQPIGDPPQQGEPAATEEPSEDDEGGDNDD